MNRIVFDDNLAWLKRAPREAFSLIYIDPPFNTGRRQARTRLRTVADRNGDRIGFRGKRYRTERHGETGFDDRFDDYVGFLRERIEAAKPLLTPDASLFLHVDCREVHYCKVMLDEVFGRESFMNEIIWAYDYGARSRRRWSPKHDSILWYVNDPGRYTFNYDEIDRIPYMAPGLVGPEKAARGKTPDGRLVAHHREPQREGEDRVRNPEAARDPRADREGPLPARRPGPRLLRRIRLVRRSGGAPRPRVRPRRQQPRRDPDHAQAARGILAPKSSGGATSSEKKRSSRPEPVEPAGPPGPAGPVEPPEPPGPAEPPGPSARPAPPDPRRRRARASRAADPKTRLTEGGPP